MSYARQLRRELQRGKYAGLTDAGALALLLTADQAAPPINTIDGGALWEFLDEGELTALPNGQETRVRAMLVHSGIPIGPKSKARKTLKVFTEAGSPLTFAALRDGLTDKIISPADALRLPAAYRRESTIHGARLPAEPTSPESANAWAGPLGPPGPPPTPLPPPPEEPDP